jgi:hypothetical protein
MGTLELEMEKRDIPLLESEAHQSGGEQLVMAGLSHDPAKANSKI